MPLRWPGITFPNEGLTAPLLGVADGSARSAVMSTGIPNPTPVSARRMVVARFRDGRLVKGSTHDFAPNREAFHIYVGGDESTNPVKVHIDQLKAILYVKTFEGNSQHQDDYDFNKVVGHGRRARVTFTDGEVMAGFTMGYHADRSGFFMIPADAESNNARVFVVNSAVKSLEWLR